ncbi:hypothetical protein AAGN90_27945, partial [Klebsiella pneumoniae]
SAQIREILISESAWEEMTCLFAPSLAFWFEYAFEKSFQRYLNRNLRRKNKMKEGEPDVHP